MISVGRIGWREAQPGDQVVVTHWTRLKSPMLDREIHLGGKVYLLTSKGVGYKRFNFEGMEHT